MDQLKVPRIRDDRHGRRAAEARDSCALAPTVRLLAEARAGRVPPLRQPGMPQPVTSMAWDIRGKQPRRIAQAAVRETTNNQMPARPCLPTAQARAGAPVPEVHLLAQQAPQPITLHLVPKPTRADAKQDYSNGVPRSLHVVAGYRTASNVSAFRTLDCTVSNLRTSANPARHARR